MGKIPSKTRILAVLVGLICLCNPSRINGYLQDTEDQNDSESDDLDMRLIKPHV